MDHRDPSTARLQELLNRAGPSGKVYDELLQQASTRLLLLTRKMLHNYPRLRRWEQTENVFQSEALRLYHSLAKLRPQTTREFFGLAVTHIRLSLIDMARHHLCPHRHGAHHHSDHVRDQPDLDLPEGHQDPLSSCPGTLEAWADFHEAMGSLPEDQREVFQLVWYAGLSQVEVAKLLNISPPTVQRRWYAAQVSLHRMLQGNCPPGEVRS